MDEEQIDYQLGASNVDTSAIENSELVPFQMESSVVFRRLAEDIYSSPKGGIREAITNAITATEKVEKDNFEPIINISVNGEHDRPELIIEDNGVGMTMNTIREVVSYIGRSTVRDDNQKAGQFGMGFLALFSLCGSKGGFIMHTNSRSEYGEPISGLWKDGGFSKFDEPQKKDMKGTRFEILLREDISVQDIREWVQDVAQWSRVSILYEDKTNEGIYSNEFGASKLDSLIENDEISITVENNYYKAVCSPDLKDNPTILLDVLIDRNCSNNLYLPFCDLAIRLKSEHPVVMKGHHKDKMIVRNAEYENLSEDRKELYVPERKVDEDIPVTPSPVGTREKLNENKKFWEQVRKDCKKEYKDKSRNILESIKNKSISEIESNEFKFIHNSLFTNLDSYQRFDTFIKSRYSNLYSDSLTQKLYALLQSVNMYKYSPDSKSVTKKGNKKVYNIIGNYDYVFMFISSFDDEKSTNIHLSDNSYIFIKIDNSNWYEFYENTFGWEKLKDITYSHPVCRNVCQNNVYNVLNKNESSTDNKSNKKVSIYTDDTYKSISIDDLPNKINTEADKYILELENINIKKLIVFPSNSAYSISNYHWMRHESYALVRAETKTILNELKNMPVTITIDEFVTSANEIELQTSQGMKKCKHISFKESILHLVPDKIYRTIINNKNINKMYTLFDENKFDSVRSPYKNNYIPITESKLDNILPLINLSSVYTTDDLKTPLDGESDGPSSSQCKLYLLEFENRNVDIIREIDKSICSKKPLSDVRLSMMSLLEEISKTDIDLKEVSSDE